MFLHNDDGSVPHVGYLEISGGGVQTILNEIAATEARMVKMFINEHNLDGKKRGKFEPHWTIAQAWQRMEQNWSGHDMDKYKKYDILLLKHELMEISVMMTEGLNASDAHELTDITYPWYTELDKFLRSA